MMFRPRFRPVWLAHNALWYAVRLNWSVCRPSECRLRALERAPRTIVLPARNMVIQIPQ